MFLAVICSVAFVGEPEPAPPPSTRKRVLAAVDDLATFEPGKFRYRGTSCGLAMRGYVRPLECVGYDRGCAVSPFLSGTSEFGTRRARLAVELHMAPNPIFEEDTFIGLPYIGVALGGLFGGEKVRGGVFALGGYYWWGAEGRPLITPWRTARGGRHGLEFTLGWGLLDFMAFGVGYRWFPALLNHHLRARSFALRRGLGCFLSSSLVGPVLIPYPGPSPGVTESTGHCPS